MDLAGVLHVLFPEAAGNRMTSRWGFLNVRVQAPGTPSRICRNWANPLLVMAVVAVVVLSSVPSAATVTSSKPRRLHDGPAHSTGAPSHLESGLSAVHAAKLAGSSSGSDGTLWTWGDNSGESWAMATPPAAMSPWL